MDVIVTIGDSCYDVYQCFTYRRDLGTMPKDIVLIRVLFSYSVL